MVNSLVVGKETLNGFMAVKQRFFVRKSALIAYLLAEIDSTSDQGISFLIWIYKKRIMIQHYYILLSKAFYILFYQLFEICL